jgi:TonB-dependent SusC/RagA subfamily outer membrane receptor
METSLFYLLRVSIAAAILYLFFKLILSKRTFHSINRIVVLGIVVMTLILPLFTVQLPEISFFKPKVEQPTIEEILASLKGINQVNTITIALTPEAKIPWIKVIGLIYLSGLIVALLRFSISFIRMGRIISAARKERMTDNSLLCISDKNVSPFSWMKYIVLSTTDVEADNLDIIRHEQAHVAFRHSFDLLFLDLYSLVFWFNPFAWLLRLELQTVHEYQADEKVLAEGANAKNYHLSLIRQCVGEYKFALANNFEYNNLHKRIKMTMKVRSSSRQKWLYSTIGLSVMLCIVILSLNGLKAKASINKLNETIKSEISKLTTNQTSDSMTVKREVEKITSPTIAAATQPAKLKENEQNKEKKKENIREISYEAQTGPKPLIIIDGEEYDLNIEAINPKDIDRIEVLKNASDTKKYGKKGQNGVILITKKKVDASSGNNEGKMSISEPVKLHAELVYDKEKDAGSAPNEVKINKGLQLTAEFHKNIPQPLILVDGKEAPANFMRNVSPASIESITVLKDTAATRIYNTKGKNGVILIKMRGKLNI